MSLNSGKKLEVEEYSPGLFDRLVSRGAKWEPSFSGPDKILVSEDLEEDEAEELIEHERTHIRFRWVLPVWLTLAFALSFVSFSYFVWCFIVGLFLWEGLAVAGERGWI